MKLRARTAALLLLLLLPAAAGAFDLGDVTALAEARAAAPFRDRPKVPAWLLDPALTYDQWRDIRFRPDRALWHDRKLPFEVQFFHPGLYYDRSIQVNEVDAGGGVHPVPFSPDRFDYGKNRFAKRIPKDVGYAGLRVHGPLKRPDYYDELVVFLGASYFRALGRDNVYGVSARGLAVDTAGPGAEEFPAFVEFWLETPAPGADHLVLYALLDGPSVAGAYRFDVHPGVETRIEVEVRLFARQAVAKLGIAPLTSMFFFGENNVHRFEDFRPEVHDSDGLLIHFDGGEWLWRPLENPLRVEESSFQARDPRGFGLLQRDRDFASYQDIETRSELRPSAWVEPRGDWGPGHVDLVELPTTTELEDNVVAFWVPDASLRPGAPLALSYALSFYSDDPGRPPGGRVVATRRDRGTVPGGYRFVVDFDGDALRALPADRPPVGVVSTGPGDAAELIDQHVVKNPITGGWRLSFQLRPKTPGPIELRAYLASGSGALTETWSYGLVQEPSGPPAASAGSGQSASAP
jgi:periplasmic glucans biosynthesis protein